MCVKVARDEAGARGGGDADGRAAQGGEPDAEGAGARAGRDARATLQRQRAAPGEHNRSY